jgi:hypothetical protein
MRTWLRELVKDVAGQIGTEIANQVSHGSHEVASTLFTGQSFVLYQRGSHDDPKIANAGTAVQREEIEREM